VFYPGKFLFIDNDEYQPTNELCLHGNISRNALESYQYATDRAHLENHFMSTWRAGGLTQVVEFLPPPAACPHCSLTPDVVEVCGCVAMVGTVAHALPRLPSS
jgi:hypothetical protein